MVAQTHPFQKLKTLAIVLPTLNEEQSIEETINRIPKDELLDKGYAISIFVVDGNSTDKTVEIAKNLHCNVHIQKGTGKGNAIKEIFEELKHEYVIMIDADSSYPIEDIVLFVDELQYHNVVIGSRFLGAIEEGSMSTMNKYGNILITKFANILFDSRISDLCSGFWGFRKNIYQNINIKAKHFELEANFFTEVIKKHRIQEVPIIYRKRRGKSKLNMLHGFDICWFLFKERFL